MLGNLAVSFAATSGSAILAVIIRDWLIKRRRNKRMRDLYVAEVRRNRRKMILNQLTAEAHENGWDLSIVDFPDPREVITDEYDTEYIKAVLGTEKKECEHVYNICDTGISGRHVHWCLCGKALLQD